MVDVRVYTHPACISCEDALNVTKEFAAGRDDIEVQLTSLASESGRARAKEAGILVVPAIQVGGETIQKVPTEDDLERMVEAARTSDA